MRLPQLSNASGEEFMIKDISTKPWGLALLKGTAIGAGGTALGSAAVQFGISGTATTSPANHTTFTDSLGRYGVTVRAGVD